MAMTDSQLTTQADVIKNETVQGANTATRVGTMLDDIISNKINNDKIDTDGTFAANSDTVVPSQKAAKTYIGSQVTAVNATITAGLALKEDTANKSNGPLGSSTFKFPTESSVKTYVDTQDALDEKIADKVTSQATFISNGSSVIKYPAVKAVKDYVDGVATGLLRDNGNYDPTLTGNYPTSVNTLSGGPVQVGDLWYIDTAGNMNGNPVLVGYSVRALINGASPTADGDWAIANVGLGYIPENTANKSDDGTFNSGSPSHVQFPTQFAVASYLAANSPTPDLQTVLGNGHTLTDGNNYQGTLAGDTPGASIYNVNAFGFNAARFAYGVNINAFGSQAAGSSDLTTVNGDNINALGSDSAYDTTGTSINALGNSAAFANTGSHVNAMGFQAAVNNTGDRVNAFGQAAGANNTFNNVNLFGAGATASADNQLVFISGTGANVQISSGSVTADRVYTLPNQSGTFAMLSDLPPNPSLTASITLDQAGIDALSFGSPLVLIPPTGAPSTLVVINSIISYYEVGGTPVPGTNIQAWVGYTSGYWTGYCSSTFDPYYSIQKFNVYQALQVPTTTLGAGVNLYVYQNLVGGVGNTLKILVNYDILTF